MKHTAPSRKPSSLGTQMVTAVALSYLIDALLIGGFAWAGTVPPSIPLYYLAAGMLDSR